MRRTFTGENNFGFIVCTLLRCAASRQVHGLSVSFVQLIEILSLLTARALASVFMIVRHCIYFRCAPLWNKPGVDSLHIARQGKGAPLWKSPKSAKCERRLFDKMLFTLFTARLISEGAVHVFCR